MYVRVCVYVCVCVGTCMSVWDRETLKYIYSSEPRKKVLALQYHTAITSNNNNNNGNNAILKYSVLPMSKAIRKALMGNVSQFRAFLCFPQA